jgi:hypothetical protein
MVSPGQAPTLPPIVFPDLIRDPAFSAYAHEQSGTPDQVRGDETAMLAPLGYRPLRTIAICQLLTVHNSTL